LPFTDICTMQTISSELQTLIDHYLPQLKDLSEPDAAQKPSPSKWSKKELIGHLVDSAQNNIRRFITAQYEEVPKISYNQDKWVAINHWQEYTLVDLINLWYALNKQIGVILKTTSSDMAQRQSQTDALHSIEWLATDYIKHMKHHLHQVLSLEEVAYP
jgi:hypothetical protein